MTDEPSFPIFRDIRKWLFGPHASGAPFEAWRAAVLAFEAGDPSLFEALPPFDRAYLDSNLKLTPKFKTPLPYPS